MSYGIYHAKNSQNELAIIGDLETTVAGNVGLRIGRLNHQVVWEQTEYIVLTPEEAEQLIAELMERLKLHILVTPTHAA